MVNQLLFFLEGTDIHFPNIGIHLHNIASKITVFGFDIAFYGIVIALAMIVGYGVTEWTARRTGQNAEYYLDFVVWAIVISVVCARAYYVIFNWSAFSDEPLSVFNLRTGGLAIYGGVIGGVCTAFVYTRIKKLQWGLFFDTCIVGLLTGQVIGRWGNFFNREAFGTYTDGPFAMQVDVTEVHSYFNPATSQSIVENAYAGKENIVRNILEIREHAVEIDGATYIQVHPTFLYESVLNLILLCGLLIYTKHKKFDGEIFLLYLLGYGVIRFFVEGLRTDQLLLFDTAIPVSQLLSAVLVVGSAAAYILLRFVRKKGKKPELVRK